MIIRGEAGFSRSAPSVRERIVTLQPEQIAAPPHDDALIEGVAILDEARGILRILAPQRIGSMP